MMLTNEHNTCRIGQKDRCGSTGCEWKKVFGNFCWLRQNENKEVMKRFVPAEDIKPFFTKKKKKKKGKVLKDDLKQHHKIKEIDFSNKISTAQQDDWLKKIKTI